MNKDIKITETPYKVTYEGSYKGVCFEIEDFYESGVYVNWLDDFPEDHQYRDGVEGEVVNKYLTRINPH